MKKSILFISFVLLLTSCKTTINLQNEKNADEQIIEYLQSKKIVFIGEHHSTVFPILYMTENMENFYNNGVRYLFLEEEGDGFFPAENYDNYRLMIVPQWCTFGWKHEYHLMELEIARINQLHPEDPINVIFPETGITWPEDMNDSTKVLNARDAQAQKTIIEIMDKAKPEDKAIIFYGSGHGMKNPDYYGDEAFWYSSGYYLNNHYGDQYASFNIYELINNDFTKVNYGKDSNFKILSEKYLRNELSEDEISNYDFYCVTNQRIYGIVSPYITTDYNLQALYNFVADFNIENNSPYKSRELSYFVLAISYLKYCFGDYFPFSFEENNLDEALAILNKKVFQSDRAPSYFCKNLPTYSIKEWEKYAEYLFSYNWLENYIFGYIDDETTCKKACGYIIYNMNQAIKMNPQDPWPQYWLAYFWNEKADLSGKKSDYEKAISEWNIFLNHFAAFACPGILTAYDRLSINYSKIGDEEQSQFYINKKEKIEKKFPWDNTEMYFFGYYN